MVQTSIVFRILQFSINSWQVEENKIMRLSALKGFRGLLRPWLHLSLALIWRDFLGKEKVVIHTTARTKSLPHLTLHFSSPYPSNFFSFQIINFLAVFSIYSFNDFLPSPFLINSGMIVDGMTDKEKLIWRGRKEASRRKREMRETKKSIKEIVGRGRWKENAADNCDFQL